MCKLLIKNICMNYHSTKGETRAIDNVSFSVDEGEFVSLVGPSGCGKSTLLNIICGLIPPSSGSIILDDKELKGHSSKMGYMFQKDHLFEWLTVWDNVCLGLKIKKLLTAEKKDKLETMLHSYGLYDFKNHHPSELSGGMRQRVALIRTLALDPEILLLDEPFSALDYQSRLKVSDEIFDIIKKENKTALMVTHDIAEAVSTSSKIIVLSKRPAYIKNEIKVQFKDCYFCTPLRKREAPEFRIYFNDIWKELDSNEDTK